MANLNLKTFFRGVIRWSYVRGLGKLTILTRASYLMLAIVPLMAWSWPAIENSRIWLLERTETARSLANDDEPKQAEIQDKNIESQKLPPSWMRIYIAALSVFIGHLIFEVACPSSILKHDSISYREHRLADFNIHRRDTRIWEAIRTVNWWNQQYVELKNRNANTGKESKLRERRDSVFESCRKAAASDDLSELSESARFDLVELSAILEFHHRDQKRYWLCLVCIAVYGIAMLLISWIFFQQIGTVFSAAF